MGFTGHCDNARKDESNSKLISLTRNSVIVRRVTKSVMSGMFDILQEVLGERNLVRGLTPESSRNWDSLIFQVDGH